MSGSAKAATAAVAATPVAVQVARSTSSDNNTPNKASTPAKPSPQDKGMAWASAMPSNEGTCQATQLTVAAPQKKGTCPLPGRGSGKRFMKATKMTSPLKYPMAKRWRKGKC